MADDGPLDAGEYAAWLGEFRQALRVRTEMDVPCGECTACCRSSMFIHIRADETDALAHIPPQVLFPAPYQTNGNVLMGHDEHGNCPMLVDDRCSIYEHRPNTCRTYDCRVYAAVRRRARQAGDRRSHPPLGVQLRLRRGAAPCTSRSGRRPRSSRSARR